MWTDQSNFLQMIKIMKMQNLYCVLFLIFLVWFGKLEAENSICGDWLPYRDEKCFKVIDDTFRTFEEAEKSCSKLENEPTLAVIHSENEQEFLSNYLFKTLKKLDNFWIGGRFANNSFSWIDNSSLDYTNWDPKDTKNKDSLCVQMQADVLLIGKWIVEPCERRNLVVCQKMQTWSTARMQKEFLDERKQHRDALDEAKNEINSLKHNLENVNKNPVPIGFIYVQLSNQPEPKTLWPAVQWKDVTSEYAGLFFRAEGGDAAQFGTEQAENAPRVTEVEHYHDHVIDDMKCGWCRTTLNVGGISSGVGVFSGTDNFNGASPYVLRFYMSGGEIRPRNKAMRIWKRIN